MDAAFVAEYSAHEMCNTAVVGVPSGTEGSMIKEFVKTSTGFVSTAKATSQLWATR